MSFLPIKIQHGPNTKPRFAYVVPEEVAALVGMEQTGEAPISHTTVIFKSSASIVVDYDVNGLANLLTIAARHHGA